MTSYACFGVTVAVAYSFDYIEFKINSIENYANPPKNE